MSESRKFNIIYADPAWGYRNVRTGGSMTSGAAQQYPVLTPAQVAQLPLQGLIADDAVLLLWVTVPLLPECLPVVPAWGFRYKTALFWHKTGRLGMGYWFRGQVEPVLVGGRGRVLPELDEYLGRPCPHCGSQTLECYECAAPLKVSDATTDLVIDDDEVAPLVLGVAGKVTPPRTVIRNWIAEPISKHSKKPESFRKLIEDVIFPLFPEPRPLELFARHQTPGWTCMGLELGQDLRLVPAEGPAPDPTEPALPLS